MKKLKFKITLLFILISVVLFSATGIAVSYFSKQAIVANSEMLSNEIVKSNADAIEEYIKARMSELQHIAEYDALKEMNVEASKAYLKRVAKDSEYESIALVNPDGQAWASTDATLDLSKSPYMKEIFENGADSFVSNPFLALSSGNIIISIAQVITDTQGNKVGLLSAAVPLSRITEISEGINIEEKGFGWIINEEGLIIAHRDEKIAMIENIIDSQEGVYVNLATDKDKILNNQGGIIEGVINGEEVYLFFATIDNTLNWKLVVEIPRSILLSSISNLNKMFVLLIMIVLLIMGVAAFMVSNTITKPISVITEYSEHISNLDFTKELPKDLLLRKDELGALSTSFNNITYNLRSFIQSISENAQYIASSSQTLTSTSSESAIAAEEVARTIEEIAKGANSQAKDTERGAESVNQLGELIEKDQLYIKDLNLSTHEVTKLKDEGLEILRDLIEKTKINNKSSREVYEIIVNTNESAEKIENVSEMIKSIAKQTNLLALNAAIEAARAGESGKGFAVVADEIRKLAEQSNSFTTEINSIIKELTDKTGHAVNTIQEVSKMVDAQAESVELTNTKFQGIDHAIQRMTEIIISINESGQVMQEKKDEIIGIIENLSAISEENAAGTEEASASVEQQTSGMLEISNASDSLARLAEDMQNNIAKFKY